ncbi:RecA-like DNA recombinase [Microbacterium phage Cheeto1]|nr:RecA-like DNA recombinase [Microbacterium phage Cheeto1]
MDINPLELIGKVWRHSGVKGSVWVPHIYKIGQKNAEKFREGAVIDSRKPVLPQLRDDVDWYWTPAVSSTDSRKAKQYPAQRVLWVDCDESYDDKLLHALRPSYMWETSPGHKQAIWLMRDTIPASEYHRDGLMGMLTQALGGDKSGVDIGQLLRVPGTWHHKRKPFQGRILASPGTQYSRGQLLTRVAKGLGFAPGLASELGQEDPYGDRSKLLWKFARNASELGLPEDLTFKLIKATAWNKWKDEPERLKEDISRAYAAAPDKPEKQAAERVSEDAEDDEEAEVEPWEMLRAGQFATVLRKPIRWVLPGIIAEQGCGLLVAAPKVGKTRVAMEIALGLATGRKPLGISVQKKAPVGFFSLEDGEWLFSHRLDHFINHDRGRLQYHWEGHIRQEGDDLVWHPGREMDLFTVFQPMDLSSDEDMDRLYKTIQKHDLKLAIIDTLSMAIGKANVSDQKDMYAILAHLKNEIAKKTGCAIMFIHHTRKRQFEKGESVQEKILGATALHGWSDFIMSLADPEEENPGLLRLAVQTKMGNNQHYLSTELKIIRNLPQE